MTGPFSQQLPNHDVPDIEISDERLSHMLGDIKRNSRNRRIAMVAPVVLAAAVLGAMIAAPPRHGGLLLEADAEVADRQLPRVFGSNGVWQLAEPIVGDGTNDSGPATVVEAPTAPDAPLFTLSPPDQEDLQSLPASTSTPPMSTSGQSPNDLFDPTDLDWSNFEAVIRVEPVTDTTAEDVAIEGTAETEEPVTSAPLSEDATTTEASSTDEGVTVAESLSEDLSEETDSVSDDSVPAEANPSTSPAAQIDSQELGAPAVIFAQSVLVHSAHVSVTVQVVDDDSSVIDWCNTRVDWGDGSITWVVGADESALCTASCEYEAETSAAGIDEIVQFEHHYTQIIDAQPRIFVATGDGCSYTLAELQLQPFTVVPLG